MAKFITTRFHHKLGRFCPKNFDKPLPSTKTAQMRIEINSFAQKDSESLTKMWDRYKELLRKCPHHGLTKWMQIYNFYIGLNAHTRKMIDTSVGGIFFEKDDTIGFRLIGWDSYK